MLQRNSPKHGNVIFRNETDLHEQSSTCEERFKYTLVRGEEIVLFLSGDPGIEKRQPLFQIDWEPLKSDARSLMVSCGSESIPGKLHVVIPIVYIRTRSASMEI